MEALKMCQKSRHVGVKGVAVFTNKLDGDVCVSSVIPCSPMRRGTRIGWGPGTSLPKAAWEGRSGHLLDGSFCWRVNLGNGKRRAGSDLSSARIALSVRMRWESG